MEIRLRATGEVISETEFYIRNPKAPRPANEAWLDTWGGDPVFDGPQATPTNVYEFSYRKGTELIDGKWFAVYALGPVFTTDEDGTSEEKMADYKAQKDAEQAKNVRDQRNRLIAESDWTQARDVTLPNDAEYLAYRQALRDVPAQAGFPWNVVWPTI
jgi:hypothetical protein